MRHEVKITVSLMPGKTAEDADIAEGDVREHFLAAEGETKEAAQEAALDEFHKTFPIGALECVSIDAVATDPKLELDDIIAAATEAYPDPDVVLGVGTGLEDGDTLARFIAMELKDIFDPGASNAENLAEAVRVMDRGEKDLAAVKNALRAMANKPKLEALRDLAMSLKIDEDGLDEIVREIKAGEAADVNNGGLGKQLELILDSCGGDLERAKKSIS